MKVITFSLCIIALFVSCAHKKKMTKEFAYESGIDPFNRSYHFHPDHCLKAFVRATQDLKGKVYSLDKKKRKVTTNRIIITHDGKAGIDIPDTNYAGPTREFMNALHVQLYIQVIEAEEEKFLDGCTIKVQRLLFFDGQEPVRGEVNKRFEEKVLYNFHEIISAFLAGDYSY